MQQVTAKPSRPSSGSVEHAPKDVLAFEFNPKKRLAHFIVKLQNTPGALEISAALATKHRVNILSGFHHAPSTSGEGFWSFFADFTDSDISPSELASELEFLPSSVDVRFKVPRNGLMIDSFHFPVRWGGQRAVIMRTEWLASIFTRIMAVFGDGAVARVVLYEMGEAAGRAIMHDLLRQLGPVVVREEVGAIVGLYSSNGWGMFDLVSSNLEKKNGEIRARDNFECLSYTRSAVARGNFMRGHIAGWFSELVENRVEVTEKYCVAKGDPFCYFTVQPPPSDKA